MTTSPRLGFSELATGETIPETAINEIDRFLETFATRCVIKDRDLSTPPGSPADGDAYLVKATGTGAWASHDGALAFYMNTAWKFVTPKEGFAAYVNDEDVVITYNGSSWIVTPTGNPTESIIIACGDETTAATTGTGKVTFRMPYAFTLSAVRASVTTAPTGSTFVIDINEAGSTILSTKLSIDASEKTSVTAATPVVISDTALADDAEITIDFDQVGATIAGAGVKVALIGTRT